MRLRRPFAGLPCPRSTGRGIVSSSISSIVADSDHNARQYYEKMEMVHCWMALKQFPKKTQHRIHRYFKSYFEINTALDESAILNDLTPALRREVALLLIRDTVRRNYLFRSLQVRGASAVVPEGKREREGAWGPSATNPGVT